MIDFRFWDKALKKMCYRKPAYNDFCQKDIVPLQYTGLNDKNGKPIYLGDILGVKLYDSVEPDRFCICEMEVKFYKGCWCLFQIGFDYSNSPWEDITILHNEKNEMEIIGNIYEQ